MVHGRASHDSILDTDDPKSVGSDIHCTSLMAPGTEIDSGVALSVASIVPQKQLSFQSFFQNNPLVGWPSGRGVTESNVGNIQIVVVTA
jgi:hypothetical protein